MLFHAFWVIYTVKELDSHAKHGQSFNKQVGRMTEYFCAKSVDAVCFSRAAELCKCVCSLHFDEGCFINKLKFKAKFLFPFYLYSLQMIATQKLHMLVTL